MPLSRKVLVDLTFRVEVTVPDDWDAHQIEFYHGDSSHCASNELRRIVERLVSVHQAREARDYCACPLLVASKYVRDATDPIDGQTYGLDFEDPVT